MEIELIILTCIIAILFAGFLTIIILKKNPGNKAMQDISEKINKGAHIFMLRETEVIIIIAIIVSAALYFFLGAPITISFIAGTIFSLMSGWIGLNISTKANCRTTEAAKEGHHRALGIAYASGSVTGLFVAGLGLLGVVILYIIFQDPDIIFGYSLGAGLISIFARIGGGIFTKAADIGADLVGKYEEGIPEDDPRNPAVIADNVGDNVGDVAGMGTDLFESYVNSIIAAMAIGAAMMSYKLTVLPMIIAAAGILSSMLSIFIMRVTPNTNALRALRNTLITSLPLSPWQIQAAAPKKSAMNGDSCQAAIFENL